MLITKYGSLSKFSNEAAENLHCLINLTTQRSTSHGEGKSTKN